MAFYSIPNLTSNQVDFTSIFCIFDFLTNSFLVMKFLYVLRHGESEHSHYEGDFQRVLTIYGKNQIQILAERLAKRAINFDQVLCSSAKRTKQTCDYILKEIPVAKVEYKDSLYECDLMELIEELQKIGKDVDHLLLVGHNPGVSALVSYFSGEFFLSMSPGDLVILSLEIEEWNFLTQDIAIISDILR
ncbi:MAG: SixA phosphatase family protein [Mongoliitalea sp.]